MALFQTSVIKTYLAQQDNSVVERAYKKYTKYFHNATIQENIKNSKEEQYQAKFLDELFVNVLGYTLNPKPDFNITTEFKNQKGAGKADGAILKEAKAIGVIELKGTNTKDLESIRKQAFDYKANQKGCVYVITSNFEKLRFYINDATEFLEFNLFQLAPEEFALMYLCLQKDNILNNLPLTIKEASLVEEDKITKQFYNDYSVFKRELFRDLVKRNAKRIKMDAVIASEARQSLEENNANENKALEKNVKLSLFKKSQKLIDRFLFIFFAEDRDLLPPNSTIQILDKWKADIDFGDERPLYGLFKQYFHFLDQGRKGTTSRAEIYAYNGGLFKPDAILDSLEIDDDLLYKHTYKLAKYDFSSQVDVNILGHIFENSLNEIESVNAEIEGGEFDKQKSKRKKDGVFYTPKYITKYIVENTVGKLCQEKKDQLGFKEEAYFEIKKGTHQNTKKQLLEVLDNYRAWLLQITICDPACGSGAFLNQALDFLIKEHRYIDELKAKVLGGGLILSDIENTILENNIYGVDLNEESVEIAKLSLWLRTAQPRRKLNDLSNNIKCGNSLIDSKNVAGDKAFNWQQEFPQIFDKGGFDVIIGNPPYVRQELFKDIKPYLEKHYKCYNSIADLYTYFIEKGINLMNERGLFSFILPNKFLKATYGKQIRKVIKEESNLELLFDFDDYPVFADATTYPIIYVLNNNKEDNKKSFVYSEINKRTSSSDPINTLETNKVIVPYESLTEDMWNFIDVTSFEILNKLANDSIELGKYVNKKIYRGLTTGRNEAFIVDGEKRKELIAKNSKNAERIKVLATGKEVKRNHFNFQDKYLLFTGYDDDIPNLYPDIQEELDNYKDALIKRYDQGENYWNLRACAYYEEMQQPKIIYPRINNRGNFYFDEKGEVFLLDNNFFISTDSKALLALLNSKLVYFYLKNVCTTLQGGFYDFRRDKITTIPISNKFKDIGSELSKLSNNLIELNDSSNKVQDSFRKYFCIKFNLEKLSGKLENWHELDFADFIKELNKAIKKAGGTPLTKKDEFEWLELFEDNKKKAQELQTQITQTEKTIDTMVYDLYGLTEEERDIVENS
ncbi:restriction endonuclease subunit M [Mangrovimonas yunxiaonensis]|uniref:site-specific DNA-methyltransferase (adenine-specific) n=2 Tax=Flavobacteriaceae TaxID=49546 RepID=A0A084TJP2_9FLAO|nr:N-6 DNA methylase [Mangrovimonas yunxiaonensis]KFB00928.1 restriction endonuclease subunit M [Mangrovimonas yunxiaonensis]GGH43591.1 type II endonuclease-methyltransferasefusion protein [Mangrovimonas yunxiaonensis]